MSKDKWPEAGLKEKFDPVSGRRRQFVTLWFSRGKNPKRAFNRHRFNKVMHLSPGAARQLVEDLQAVLGRVSDAEFWEREEA